MPNARVGRLQGILAVVGLGTGVGTHGINDDADNRLYNRALNLTGGGRETLKAIGSSGTAVTLALVPGSDGNIQSVSNSASCTYTMPSALEATKAISFTLVVTNAGAFTATFTGVKWPSALAPTLTSGAAKVDIFSFLTVDGGTTWYGNVTQDIR